MTDPNLIEALQEIDKAIEYHTMIIALGLLAIVLVLLGIKKK